MCPNWLQAPVIEGEERMPAASESVHSHGIFQAWVGLLRNASSLPKEHKSLHLKKLQFCRSLFSSQDGAYS